MRFLLMLFAAACGCSSGLMDADTSHDDSDEFVVNFVDENNGAIANQRYGEFFAVNVSGASPHEGLTITTTLAGYRSENVFLADANGEVRTARDAPDAGTYSGVSAEGVVWSSLPDASIAGQGLDIDVTVTAGARTAAATLHRRYLDEDLEVALLDEPGLVATMFRPTTTSGPLPGLIVIGGSEGGIGAAEFQASWLAGYGYAALAVAYFGMPGLPSTLANIPLEHFDAAIAVLQHDDRIDSERLGIVGGSRGGELALLLASKHPELRAVVAQLPSAYVYGGENDEAAWSWQGQPVVPLDVADVRGPQAEVLASGVTGYRLTPMFEDELARASAEQLEAARIHVEDIAGPILLTGGDDDGVWPSCQYHDVIMEKLEATGHRQQFADAALCVPGAGHAAAFPGWSTFESVATDMGDYWLILGGSPQRNADAQRQSLTAMRAFLELAFASAR